MNAIPPSAGTLSITVEVLRTRLEAIGREAGIAIERTAISPVVSETKDYSITITDSAGNLVVGTGYITGHFGGSVHAIRSTLEQHAGTIEDGDVFLANDPHNGGGLHPQDVVVQRPVFVGAQLVAWVAVSAHMMDFGGMTPGSFSPHATECYQEALRLPPVRIFAAGKEVKDTWAIVRNNIRLASLVEADMRALVVGCNVAVQKIKEVVSSHGADAFAEVVSALGSSVERELRRRIALIADGVYRATGWLELGEYEAYAVPCQLTVTGDRLHFDYAGCPEQLPRFFNTKPYIVQSNLASSMHAWLAPDLPYSQPLLDMIEIDCPARSILNCVPPAPIAASHMDATGAAMSAGVQCLQLALAASPDAPGRRLVSSPDAMGWAMMTWTYTRADGEMDTFIHTDGTFGGSPAGSDRDGLDLSLRLVGTKSSFELSDVEILESNYPILIEERNSRSGGHGMGEHRSGASCHEILRPHGTAKLIGNMISARGSVPNVGWAGGGLGARTALRIIRGDGSIENIAMQAAGILVTGADRFELKGPTGGGFGDPLARDADHVLKDIRLGRLSAEDAFGLYGVVLDECGLLQAEETAALRQRRRNERLALAHPASHSFDGATASAEGGIPLFPGIVQIGQKAVSLHSGAILAEAPNDWTEGCPTVEAENVGVNGFVSKTRSYLDPITGNCLFVDLLRPDGSRSFASRPLRWAA